ARSAVQDWLSWLPAPEPQVQQPLRQRSAARAGRVQRLSARRLDPTSPKSAASTPPRSPQPAGKSGSTREAVPPRDGRAEFAAASPTRRDSNLRPAARQRLQDWTRAPAAEAF